MRGSYPDYSYANGGGLYNLFASLIVRSCTFTANNAKGGGGMFNEASNPIVTRCVFYRNLGGGHGGGIKNYYHEDSGTWSNPVITDCTFIDNLAGYAGGIYNKYSTVTINNCLFNGNLKLYTTNGGAAVHNNAGTVTLTNCTLINNTSQSPQTRGISSAGTATLTNCILWGNGNSLVSDEDAQIWASGTFVVNYCAIQGWTGSLGGTGNTGEDPNFALVGDYYLMPDSPCVDAGDNNSVPEGTTLDLDGCPRFYDVPDTNDTGNGAPPIVDMGVHEYDNSLHMAVTPTTIEFFAYWGNPDPNSQTVKILRVGDGNIYWSISWDCSWLAVEPNMGRSIGDINEVTVIHDPNAANSPRIVGVELTVGTICRADIGGEGIGDGNVNFFDLLYFTDAWLMDDCEPMNQWCYFCDFDQSGEVDGVDFAILAGEWGQVCYPP